MSDVARRAGVSTATVSLALNDHPRISLATKKRIRRLCRTMKYRPNAAAQALAAQKKKTQEAERSYIGTLGLLEHAERAAMRKTVPHAKKIDALVVDACRQAGYRLNHFVIGETAEEHRAVSRVLDARGIRGILIHGANLPVSDWAFDWDRFAAVVYSGSIHERFIHNVMTSSYQDVYDAMFRIQNMGYRRPGFALFGHANVDYWLAGYAYATQTQGKKNAVRDLVLADDDQAAANVHALEEWFTRYRPDVILSNGADRIIHLCESIRVRIPEDAGLFCVDVMPGREHVSGLLQNRSAAYRIMVDLVHGMLQRNEKGPPEEPYLVQIPTGMNEGTTLPSRTGIRLTSSTA
jgi:DNA-binding LacI/PurR family transcriptional regulator